MHKTKRYSPLSESEYNEICKRIGYMFRDRALLLTAFTHVSCVNETKGRAESGERLEFLGDRLVGFVVAEDLYAASSADPGKMTEMMQRLVSKQPFCDAIERMGIFPFVRMGGSMQRTGASDKAKSDLFEAVAAAVYLDSGRSLAAAATFVHTHLRFS